MKAKSTFILLLFILSNVNAQDNEGLFKYFFKPRPIDKTVLNANPTWGFKPTVQIPTIKVTESIRENSELDATFLASAGGGLTLQRSIVNENGKNYTTFSWSPVLILITGDTSKDNPLDLSYCTTLGFFNNLLQIGAGYDFGTVENRSRFFGVLSLGINITNN